MNAVARVVPCSFIHLGVAFASAYAAEGLDLDQLRSRSEFSEFARIIYDILMFPHDAAMRAIPNAVLVDQRYLIPGVVIANSLMWGVGLYLVWRLSRPDPSPPLSPG